tara:strand:+ start:2639 stop:2878 length:240 start_codon:yes stop_codon:yes gene_type:complete
VNDYKKSSGMYNDQIYTKNYVALFYRDQLKKFKKIGLGKQTEYGIEITRRLIKVTERRFKELKPTTSLKVNKKEEKWRV